MGRYNIAVKGSTEEPVDSIEPLIKKMASNLTNSPQIIPIQEALANNSPDISEITGANSPRISSTVSMQWPNGRRTLIPITRLNIIIRQNGEVSISMPREESRQIAADLYAACQRATLNNRNLDFSNIRIEI